MVQRTGLAVILLLLMAVGSLYSQALEGFTPPRLSSEAILDIPANWEQSYFPSEVMILVEIKADSTATLVRILDGKNELKPLIDNLLPYLIFYPAVADGKVIDSTLSLKLTIRREGEKTSTIKQASADSLHQIDANQIFDWINHERWISNRQTLFSSDSDIDGSYSPRVYDTFYMTNYYLMGLNSKPYIILKDGFLQSSSIYYNSLQFQMWSNFRHLRLRGNVISFANEHYTSPAMCTDIYAGLGDYEYNFARIQILKNHLLGVKDFYIETGLLVQNGWWQETISNQTSSRLFLSLPVEGTTLSVNWEKYDQNIPSTSLLSGLWSSTLFRIAQVYQETYVKWQLPWFAIGWRAEQERLNSTSRINRQEYKSNQLLFKSDYQTSLADFDLTYQYNYQRTLPLVQSLYQYNNDPQHQVILNMGKQAKTFDYETQILFSEDGLGMGRAEAGYSGRFGRFGVFFNQFNSKHASLSDSLFYLNASSVSFPSVSLSETKGLKYKCKTKSSNLILDVSFGTKNLSVQSQDDSKEIFGKDYTTLFSESMLKISKQIDKYSASYVQTLQWNQFREDLPELPEIQGQSRVKLERDMGHNNALSAGLNLTGHSDYTLGNEQKTDIYGALLADVWLGVKITDLFEFQITMSNLGNNTLYGVYPHPRTFLTTIHWFYLN